MDAITPLERRSRHVRDLQDALSRGKQVDGYHQKPALEKVRLYGSAWTEFLEWCEAAARGAKYIYHQGMLTVDREKDPSVRGAAELAMDLEARGKITLTQRRISQPGGFRYIATRTSI